MKVHPQISLAFDGQCEAAFRHYESCLGGKILFVLSWGDSPMAAQAPPGWSTKVMHAAIRLGDVEITGSDVPPDQYEAPAGFEIMLNVDEPETAESVFQQMSDRGRIKMPLQETFWARRYGVLVDRFGIPWSVNCGAGEPDS